MVEISIYDLTMQVINFLLMLFILKKILYKPMLDFLAKRQHSIADTIAEAKENKVLSDKLIEDKKEELKAAKNQSQEILAAARGNAEVEQKKIIEEAKDKSINMIEDAKKEIDSQFKNAKSELLKNISDTVIMVSEKVIATNLDKKSSEKLIESCIEKI